MRAPRIGLVLGGGGARGAFTTGVISYLRFNAIKKFRDFPVISGTSTGALVGTMVCLRQFAKLEKIYTTVQTGDIINPNQSLIASTLGLEAAALASMLFGDDAVFSSDALQRIIDRNIDFTKVRQRAATSRLLLNTVDLQTGEIRIYDNAEHDEGTLRDALVASASEPVFMPPIDIATDDGVLQHVDGGVRELVPFRGAFRSGVDVDVLIAVLTNPVEAEETGRVTGILPTLVRTLDLTLSDVGVNDVTMARYVNALVRMRENAEAAGSSDVILEGVEPDIIEDLEGKRSVPIIQVTPETRLPVNSLEFDPEIMQDLFTLGFNRGIEIIEPWLQEWYGQA